jgi:hypothetical protein
MYSSPIPGRSNIWICHSQVREGLGGGLALVAHLQTPVVHLPMIIHVHDPVNTPKSSIILKNEYPTNSMELSRHLCSYSRITQHIMEPEGSLSCSQESSTGPYPQPDQSNSYHSILQLIRFPHGLLLQTVARKRLVKTKQAGKGFAYALMIRKLWWSAIALWLLVVPSGVYTWSINAIFNPKTPSTITLTCDNIRLQHPVALLYDLICGLQLKCAVSRAGYS